MLRAIFFALLLVLSGTAFRGAELHAQGDAYMELYGEGVHRFFAGELQEAEILFSRVIESGSQDPRPFYFRGLVQEHLGGSGDPDFEQGAQMEAEGKLAVPVGDALTRIQGYLRSRIEDIRRDARVAYLQQREALDQVRREESRNVPGAVESTVPDLAQPPVPSTTDDTPFDEGMRSSETVVDPVQPTVPEVDATSDPFQDDPAPVMEAQPGDTAPATDPFGEAPAATDPFGGDAGAGDAFGTPPAAEEPVVDPFGGDATPAGDATDPFGGDDPFGNS